jgi:hypothetical protein
MAGGKSAHRREVRACQRCRTLKVGCDKAKPACRRCVKAGVRCVVRHIESNGIDRSSTNGDTGILTEAQDDSLRNRDEVRLTGCLLLPSTHAAVQITSSSVSNKNGSFHSPLSYLKSIPQKRNRNPVSCIRCRRLKVRCDRQQQCHRCTKAKVVCAYGRLPEINHDFGRESSADNLSATARFAAWSGRFRTGTHWINLVREVCTAISFKWDQVNLADGSQGWKLSISTWFWTCFSGPCKSSQ